MLLIFNNYFHDKGMRVSKSYSKTYRIMHWAIAVSFTLLLVTIFLRLTWMNKNHMADIIGVYLTDAGTSLPQDDLIVLAKKIRHPMWQWHTYIGYVLVGLFTIRFMLPIFGEMKFQNPFKKLLSVKEKFQFWVYIIFYVCVTASLITGLIIELGPKTLRKQVEDWHKLSIYYLVAYMVIHLTSVLIAELTKEKGLVSRIISGSNKN